MPDDLLARRARQTSFELQSLRNRDLDLRGVVKRCQVDKPDSIRERKLDVPGHRENQTRLPDASSPGQRHESHDA
jgi:hypothetical protein